MSHPRRKEFVEAINNGTQDSYIENLEQANDLDGLKEVLGVAKEIVDQIEGVMEIVKNDDLSRALNGMRVIRRGLIQTITER